MQQDVNINIAAATDAADNELSGPHGRGVVAVEYRRVDRVEIGT